MRPFLATMVAIWGIFSLVGCETSDKQYDGVSRFAGNYGPFYGPGSLPREHPTPPLADRAPAGSPTGNI